MTHNCGIPKETREPEDGRYRREEKLPFGAAIKIPDPVNITLDTDPLKEFVD